MQSIIRVIEQINYLFFRLAGYLVLVLSALTFGQVIFRYLLNQNSIALQELQWHIYAIIFFLGIPYTLKIDGHVRVDVLYSKLSPKNQKKINLLGSIFFLLPIASCLIWYGIQFTGQSINYPNLRPDDFYTSQILSKNNIFYEITHTIEKFFRKYLFFGEISSDPSGLEGRWIIKALIPFGSFLLLCQAICLIFRNFCRDR